MKKNKKEKKKLPMQNITINIPDIYDKNIQLLINNKLIASRSEAIRTAIKEFLYREFERNLDLLGFDDSINLIEKRK